MVFNYLWQFRIGAYDCWPVLPGSAGDVLAIGDAREDAVHEGRINAFEEFLIDDAAAWALKGYLYTSPDFLE